MKAPKEFKLGDNMFDGIIAHLTRQCGGNIVDNNIVDVTTTNVFWHDLPRNVFDLDTETSFCSDDKSDQWICIDFKDRKVVPSRYSLSSDRLKSWIIEGSAYGSVWKELDRRDDNEDLNGTPAANNEWTIKEEIFSVFAQHECRFIRLRQTGSTHTGHIGMRDRDLVLHKIEFFGTLTE